MVTMEMLIKRKQSLEEEISLCRLLMAYEHRTFMRDKIQKYINQIEKELMQILR